MDLTVEVTSGFGAASKHKLPSTHGLPWTPTPGTLNVLTIAPAFVDVKPFGELEWFGHIEAWWLGTVTKGSRVQVAVLGIKPQMEPGWKLELLAESHLRNLLGLADGDRVTLSVWP